MTRFGVLIGLGLVVGGCVSASDEQRQMESRYSQHQRQEQQARQAQPTQPTPPDSSLKHTPIRTINATRPTAPPQPAQTLPPVTPPPPAEPVVATLIDVLKDKVLVSPYTLVSPISGRWAWVPDPTFVLILNQDGQMQYGPQQSGFYQMVSPTKIRFQITQVNGVSVGGTAPQDWQVAFFENNAVLLLSRGAQAMPFKRLE